MTLPNATGVGLSALIYVKKEWQSLAKIFAPSLILSTITSLLPLFVLFSTKSTNPELVVGIASLAGLISFASAMVAIVNSLTAFRFIHAHMIEQPLSIEQARDWSVQDLFRYLRSMIVATLYALALGVGVGFIGAALLLSTGGVPSMLGNMLLGIVGILFILAVIVTVLYFSTMFLSVQYHSIIEKKNGFPSVKESIQLTKPYRFQLIGKLIWCYIAIFFGLLFTPAILVTCLLVMSLFFAIPSIAPTLLDAFLNILSIILLGTAMVHVNLQYVLAMKKG